MSFVFLSAFSKLFQSLMDLIVKVRSSVAELLYIGQCSIGKATCAGGDG